MKITGTINLDVRDISTTYEYGRLILNAGNKQVGIQLTYEAGELLQAELLKVLPNTNISGCYKNYTQLFNWDTTREKILVDFIKEEKIPFGITSERLTLKERAMIEERLKAMTVESPKAE